MSEMIDTTEMYLRILFELEEEGVVPMRARIAERLGQSGPTVSQTVARMERDGLLTLGEDRTLELTPRGRTLATRVMRRHRLAERLLVDVLGLEWAYAHEEACRWEHVLSDRVERRILTVLGTQTESPYGNPIPGLDELGGPQLSMSVPEGVGTITSLPGPGDHVVMVRRINEPAQREPQELRLLAAGGLLPGHRARITFSGNEIQASALDGPPRAPVGVPAALAGHVLVTPAGDTTPQAVSGA